jgi:drug/metabolite transporter (DMT)-like permease
MKFLAQLLKRPALLFVVLLILDVSVLVLEKFGATAAGTAVGDELGFTLRLAQTPSVWGVAVLSLLQLLVWSRILSKTELSVAYPISSLFFPLSMLCSVFVFGEHVTWVAWAGALLITLGIACFSLDRKSVSEHAEPALDVVSESDLNPSPIARPISIAKPISVAKVTPVPLAILVEEPQLVQLKR